MYVAAHIVSILLTGVMAAQDFRSRSISVWLLPVICVSLTVTQWVQSDWSVIGYNAAVNMILLLGLYIAMTIWFSLKARSWVRLDDVYIGRGDLLLLLLLAPVFAPFNYLLFFISGSAAALVVYGILNLFRPDAKRLIPLAGMLGITLVLFCLYELISDGSFRLSSDFLNMILNNYLY
ncbi:MAG: hypothetical protein RL007_535 [Bacteroidota bacterium]|jgi:hypothetical protein